MAKIGIDFGTSNTKVSRIAGNGEAKSIDFDNKSVMLPTVLFYKNGLDTPQLIGQKAFNMYQKAKSHPEMLLWVAKDLKRNLSRHGRPTPNPELTYVDAVCDLFKYIKSHVEASIYDDNEEVTEVCITYPVKFDETQKELLKEAARKAGFLRVVLLKEPSAAAMGYLNYLRKVEGKTNTDEAILVYDFGGGTIDVSYVELKRDGIYCPLDSFGDSDCGGENIDLEIYKAWDKLLFSSTGKHLSPEEGLLNIPFLRSTCRENKETMSEHFKGNQHKSYTLEEFINDDLLQLEVSYEQWRKFIDPTVERTMAVVDEMMSVVSKADKKIDNIILIGGSSNLEQVKIELKKRFGKDPITVESKDIAVSNGAAIFIEHGVPVVTCYCMNCGKQIDNTVKYCSYCTPKTQAEDTVHGWDDEWLINGHVKNLFYDKRCEEITGD